MLTTMRLRGGATALARTARPSTVTGVLVCAFGAFLTACGGDQAVHHSDSACAGPRASAVCHILFIGNSYTYANDLPLMLTRLAATGTHVIETESLTEGNATLADHVASPETALALGAPQWNVVVLQEQSEIPANPRERQTSMYPAASRLVKMITDKSVQPVLYLTWAHQDGWLENGLPTYSSMQSAVDTGYLNLAGKLHVTVAPVGYAWAATLEQEARARLWSSDGSHPTAAGTYLAACVFYATVFRESPTGLKYHSRLTNRLAKRLQEIASQVVLGEPTRWNLY